MVQPFRCQAGRVWASPLRDPSMPSPWWPHTVPDHRKFKIDQTQVLGVVLAGSFGWGSISGAWGSLGGGRNRPDRPKPMLSVAALLTGEPSTECCKSSHVAALDLEPHWIWLVLEILQRTASQGTGRICMLIPEALRKQSASKSRALGSGEAAANGRGIPSWGSLLVTGVSLVSQDWELKYLLFRCSHREAQQR